MTFARQLIHKPSTSLARVPEISHPCMNSSGIMLQGLDISHPCCVLYAMCFLGFGIMLLYHSPVLLVGFFMFFVSLLLFHEIFCYQSKNK